MTGTEAALLRAICEYPDEDTPRLVYADYLDELGGPSATARAAFIRLHVRAARVPKDDPEYAPLADRSDRLLCAWDVAWQTEMPAGFTRLCGYRRGFAWRAGANASAVTAAADDPRLLGIEYLELTPDVPAARLRAVFAQPLFARLTDLVVRCGPLPRGGARALAGGAYPRLERLALARMGLGHADLRALGGSRAFPRLRVLDIGENGLTAPALRGFRRSRLFARLERVNDGGNLGGSE